MIDSAGVQLSIPWVETSTQIRLLLGEFCLANIRFRASTLPGLDWRYPVAIADEEIHKELQSGVEAAYLNSLPTADHLPRLSFRKHWFRYVPWQGPRRYIDIEGAFQEYLARFGAKSRNTLARRVRRFAEASGGTGPLREYRSAADVSAFFEAASQVTVKTYQYKLLKSGLLDDYRRDLVEMADLDRFRGYVLFHRETPVAFAFCTALDDILSYQCPGYDPAFQQYAPGTVLLYHILNSLFSERRFRVFDFGTGDAAYKSFFGTGEVHSAAVYHFSYTPKNLLFLAVHSATSLASAAAAKLLSALRIKHTIKKAIRRAF